MRYGNKADIALLIVLLLFIPAITLKIMYNGSFIPDMLFFTIEASLIGSIADWFAVTALFRRPLGFSWHTALVPKNRDRLTDSIALMVEQELLNREGILVKLDKAKIVPVLSSLIENTDADTISSIIENYLGNKLPGLDISLLGRYLEGFIKDGVKKIDLAMAAHIYLRNAVESDQYEQLLASVLPALSSYIRSDKTKIRIYRLLKKSTLSNQSGGPFAVKAFLSLLKGGNHLNLVTLSAMIQGELSIMLDEMHDPENPLARLFGRQLVSVVAEQTGDASTVNKLEEWKNRLIDRLDLKQDIQKALLSVIQSEPIKKAVIERISREFAVYLRSSLLDSHDYALETIIKNAAASLIKTEYHLLGETVRDTLKSFTDVRLVRFIEEKVGDDLQWIRINGTIVGGTVGILIFLFLRLFYEPVIVILLRRIFAC